MAIFTRFECPRCQHMFVTEGDADAFADCPKCQSMALAVGEATTGTVQGLPGVAPVSDEGGAFSEPTAQGGGVFSQLLEGVVGADTTSLPDGPPETSDEGRHPFDESTVASSLPASLLASHMMSAEDPYASDEEDPHRAATEVLRREPEEPTRAAPSAISEPPTADLGTPFSENELESAFDLPSDDEEAWENGPPPSVPTRQSAPQPLDEDAWDDGPPAGVPTKAAAAALPRPPTTGEIPRRNLALDITRGEGASNEDLPSEFSLELHEEPRGRGLGPAERQGVWDPSFQSGELRPGAVLLSELEAQYSGGVRLDEAADQGALSGQELSALEHAFSRMAGEPPTRAEDALRQVSQQASSSLFAIPSHSQLQRAVPAPPAEGEPPPLKRRQRPAHLTLSEEAKALAGIPIQATLGASNIAVELTRGSDRPVAEAPPARHPKAEAPRAVAREAQPTTAETREITETIRPARAKGAKAEPEEPKLLEGFTFARVAAVVLVATLLGLGTGVLLAPKPEPKPMTPRTRAEQQFSEGNQYYAQGRFDDAFGSYRGAISLDRTFAPAHRAKAAALAKLQRGEEAASAYRTYLEISPDAVDAEQVKEVLRRYEQEASP